jgi:hypothetical protein
MDKRVYFNRQTAGSAGFLPLQIPRFLFSGDTTAYAKLARMSNNAKILYALLLDRLGTNDMSINFLEKPWHNDEKLMLNLHGGYDKRGNAYVYYDFFEIQKKLSLPNVEDALEVMVELEKYAMVEIIQPNETEPPKFYPLAPALTPA